MDVRKLSHHYLADQLNGDNNLEIIFKFPLQRLPYMQYYCYSITKIGSPFYLLKTSNITNTLQKNVN